MKKKIEYQVSFDVESEIEFLELIDETTAMFSIYRSFPEGIFDGEEDEAQAIWSNGEVMIEGYGTDPNEQEKEVITEMMKELQEKGAFMKEG